jgi:hypothetical protein
MMVFLFAQNRGAKRLLKHFVAPRKQWREIDGRILIQAQFQFPVAKKPDPVASTAETMGQRPDEPHRNPVIATVIGRTVAQGHTGNFRLTVGFGQKRRYPFHRNATQRRGWSERHQLDET